MLYSTVNSIQRWSVQRTCSKPHSPHPSKYNKTWQLYAGNHFLNKCSSPSSHYTRQINVFQWLRYWEVLSPPGILMAVPWPYIPLQDDLLPLRPFYSILTTLGRLISDGMRNIEELGIISKLSKKNYTIACSWNLIDSEQSWTQTGVVPSILALRSMSIKTTQGMQQRIDSLVLLITSFPSASYMHEVIDFMTRIDIYLSIYWHTPFFITPALQSNTLYA